MNMPPGDIPNLRDPFQGCATATSEDVVHEAIHDFLEALRTYKNEDEANNDEYKIRYAFIEFLDRCDFLGTKPRI